MKKMNFYFNFGRCCNLLLPALLFLTGTFAFAGNGGNTPSNNVRTAKVSKKATAVAGNLILTFTTQTGGGDGTGTTRSMCGMKTGAITWSITSAATNSVPTGFTSPFFLRAEFFGSTGISVGSVVSRQYNNSTDLAGSAWTASTASSFGLGPDIYTVRVTAENPVGEVLEQRDFNDGGVNGVFNNLASTLTVLPSNDTEDPIVTVASPTKTLAATAACGIPAFLAVGPLSVADAATLGITATDCFLPTVTFSIVSISAPITVGGPCRLVTVRANDNRLGGAHQTGVVDATNDRPDVQVCVNVTDQTAPVWTAQGNIVLTANNCDGTYTLVPTYVAPTASDNCGVVSTSFTGPAPLDILGVGVYTVTYTAKDAAGNTGTRTFTITINPSTTPPAPLVCIGQLNIGLNSNCTNELNALYFAQPTAPGLCPPTGVTIAIQRNGAFGTDAATAIFTRLDIGKTLQYRLTKAGAVVGGVTYPAQSCWGFVTVEDKSGPILVCPANITLQCNDLNAIGALLPTATAGTSTGNPSISDCSAATASYSDAVVYGCSQSTARVVTRTWVAKDVWGNVSSTCQQIITVTRALDATVPVADGVPVTCPLTVANTLGMFEGGNSVINCSTGNVAGVNAVKGPYVILSGVRYYLADNTVCGLSATVIDSRVLPLCPGSFKTIKTWRVVDLCGTLFPANNLTMSCDIQQVIVFNDDVAPVATASYINYNLVADATTTCAEVTAMIPAMIPATVKLQGIPVVNAAMIPTTTIKPRATSNMCGAVDIDMTITPSDVCGVLADNPVTVSDSRLTVTAAGVGSWRITGTIMNVSTTVFSSFLIRLTDKCGNVATNTVQFRYEDNISPVAICDGVTATLNNLKLATVAAVNFNQRSTDNCGIAAILVAKNVIVGGQDRPSTYCSDATYGCADTNATRKIWIRYIDFNGNYTDCCVPLTILDKAFISCFAPTIPFVYCNDPKLNNFANLFVSPTIFYDGCDRIDSVVTIVSTPITCGDGSYTKRWVYGIKNALGEQTSAVCTQVLTVKPIRGFRVTPIARRDLACSGNVPTLDADKATIVASLQTIHDGSNTSVAGTAFPTCSGPVVEAAEWTYSNTDYCKVIVRTFTVKDICDFSDNTGANDYGTVRGTALQSVMGVVNSTTPMANIIRFTTYTYIRDLVAPVSVAPADTNICAITTCNFSFTRTVRADDGCAGVVNTGSSLFFTWRIVDNLGVQITNGSGTGPVISANGLAFGTYTVFYRVADYCGNLSTEYSFKVTGADCKAPEILVHTKTVALAGQTGPNSTTGMARLFYDDIKNRITDNCAGDLTNSNKNVIERVLSTDPTNPTSPRSATNNTGNNPATDGVMFTCADAGTVQLVRVWATDGAFAAGTGGIFGGALGGNWNYALTQITVQDNDGICTARPPVVAGTIGTENNSPVKDVVVSASTNGIVAGSATTPALGTFNVTGLTAGSNVQVRAAKTIDTDKKNGVTTLDIALISKHLLAIEPLNSPYKIIAADVNKDGFVDATDMLYVRRFILNITPTLPAGSAWRFVDKSYNFRDAANPLSEDFSEVVNLSSIPAGTNAANFTAVKLGDVNNSFDATTVRGSRVLAFNANDMDVVAGNEYTVAINAENFNASAFQGTFAFAGATVKAVKAGSLNNLSDANFGMFTNEVSASWNGKSVASADVVNITFVAAKSGKLSDMLTVNSAVTMAEGYDAAGNAMNVTLKFNTGKVAGGEFALYQNTPNPVALSTKIGFNLPKDGQAKLTIYTTEGKVLSVINNGYKAGYNEVTINKSDLNASGMLYYRLDTQDNSSTRKMIIIE